MGRGSSPAGSGVVGGCCASGRLVGWRGSCLVAVGLASGDAALKRRSSTVRDRFISRRCIDLVRVCSFSGDLYGGIHVWDLYGGTRVWGHGQFLSGLSREIRSSSTLWLTVSELRRCSRSGYPPLATCARNGAPPCIVGGNESQKPGAPAGRRSLVVSRREKLTAPTVCLPTLTSHKTRR